MQSQQEIERAELQAATETLIRSCTALGMPMDQIENFYAGGYWPHPRQASFHAYCRLADSPNGPSQVAFGGARGPGKSHACLAQLTLDDARRFREIYALFVRKFMVGGVTQMRKLCSAVLAYTPYNFREHAGELTVFDATILIRGFRNLSDIEGYLGQEYGIIIVEEATTLSAPKYQALRNSNRTADELRPRIYLSTNPGGVGHIWFKKRFVDVAEERDAVARRMLHEKMMDAPIAPTSGGPDSYFKALPQRERAVFVSATVEDNPTIDEDYQEKLEDNVGWELDAYRYGRWDIEAGLYFSSFDREIHVMEKPHRPLVNCRWMLSHDYGWTHLSVFTLMAYWDDGTALCCATHAGNEMTEEQHSKAVKEMLIGWPQIDVPKLLSQIVSGVDVFAESTTGTIADAYQEQGLTMVPANTDRVQGAARIQRMLGRPREGLTPSLYILASCEELIETFESLEKDPARPSDVKKVDRSATKMGDDFYDSIRYNVMADPWEHNSFISETDDTFTAEYFGSEAYGGYE